MIPDEEWNAGDAELVPTASAAVKKVRNNVAIYNHALPRIHVIGG